MSEGNCRFAGKGVEYFPTVFIHLFLLSVLTFGIYTPWAWVKLLRLKASHTRIRGLPVRFDGSGAVLFKLSLGYGILTLVTLGVFGPWAICAILKWRAENTFVGDQRSRFTGTGGDLFPLYVIHLFILPMITFGLYFLYGVYLFFAWKEEHILYGGEKTSFGAGFMEFLKITLISSLLNTLTLNLYSPWSMCMLYRWQIGGLLVGDTPDIRHFQATRARPALVAAAVAIGLIPYALIGWFIKSQWDHMHAVMQQPPALTLPRTRPPLSTEAHPPESKASQDEIQAVAKASRIPQPIEAEIDRLTKSIETDPGDPDLFYNRAWLYAATGEDQQAAAEYSNSLDLDPEHGDALYNRALVFIRLQEYEKALEDLDALIRLEPDAADALCNRGNVRFLTRRKELALEDYDDALRLKPNDREIIHNRDIVLATFDPQEKKTAEETEPKKQHEKSDQQNQ